MSRTRKRDSESLWRLGRILILVLASVVLAFNLGVLVVVALTSLTASNFLVFPPDGLSFRWYGELSAYKDSILFSLKTALVAATVAAALGTLAAIALVRGQLRFRDAILNFLLSPLIVPSTVFGLTVLIVLSRIGWRPGFWPLTLALAVHSAPFCIRIIASGLENIDWELEAAARTLGASRRRSWATVLLPLAAPSIAAGWMFSFIFAFDDSTISIMLARPTEQTYGAQLVAEIDEFLTPRVAAAGTAVITITIVSVALLGLIYRIHRRRLGIGRSEPISDAVDGLPDARLVA